MSVAQQDRHQNAIRRLKRELRHDGDFAGAADLLGQLCAKGPLRICRCRRGLLRRLGGKTHCPLHRRPGMRPVR